LSIDFLQLLQFILLLSEISRRLEDMDETIANRVRELRNKLKLTQGELAQKLGLKYSAISMIERGKASLTEQNVRIICLTFGVNEVWLRSGLGEIFTKDSPLKDELIAIFDRLSFLSQKMLLNLAKTMLNEQTIDNEVLEAPKNAENDTITALQDQEMNSPPREAPQEAEHREFSPEPDTKASLTGKKRA
jgi:transcriptional regulator with XRE-family HTH domain